MESFTALDVIKYDKCNTIRYVFKFMYTRIFLFYDILVFRLLITKHY